MLLIITALPYYTPTPASSHLRLGVVRESNPHIHESQSCALPVKLTTPYNQSERWDSNPRTDASKASLCSQLHNSLFCLEGGVRTHAPNYRCPVTSFQGWCLQPLDHFQIYCRGKEIRTLEHQFPKLARLASAEHPDISF